MATAVIMGATPARLTQVDGYQVHIEVTGSFKAIRDTDALWVRPDKLNAAIASLRNGIVTYVAHETP